MTGSRTHLVAAAALAVLIPISGCSHGGGSGSDGPVRAVDAAPLVHFSATGEINPDQPFTVTAQKGGRLTDVTVTAADGRQVAGRLAADQRSWQAVDHLRAGARYTARVAAEAPGGGRGETTAVVSTTGATDLLTAELGPDSSGSGTYGVGQPLTVKLSRPVKDHAARQEVERGLRVESEPAVTGAWYWVDDRELHFRPQDYWPAHARIRLTFDRQGLRIADDLYGGEAVTRSFRTGDRVEAVIDAGAHQLTYRRNGEVISTIPVTTGKPGFDTRNGIKVVLGQEQEVRMSSETIGIAAGSRDSYDLDVRWATRVTWSGEYVHAAPWSVSSQGAENVSHGCTGMSTDNAQWFFKNTRVGDIVQVVNSQGSTMEPFGNGFGDWNVSWSDWVRHSALGKPVETSGSPGDGPASGALTPQT